MVRQQNDNKQDEIFLVLVPIDSTSLEAMEMSVSEPLQGELEEWNRDEIWKI